MNKFALITGASKGIGRSMAFQLAKSGYHLLLVARSATELEALALQIQQDHQVKAFYLTADLSTKSASLNVANWVNQQTDQLTVLINNAGYGLWGDFEALNLEEQMNMLHLNINAVVELSHHLLPVLKAQQQAFILNISSTAAYQAVPTLALYAASKTFVLSYSRALRYELRDTPVSVSCLCPGPTDTGFASRAGLDALADLAEKFNMLPEAVAQAGLKGMFSGKAEIIPGFLNKLSAFGARHLPKTMIERITASLYKR